MCANSPNPVTRSITSRGFTADSASQPRPQRSITPGRKFSISTSLLATSPRSSSCPRGLERSSVIASLLRPSTFHHSPWPSLRWPWVRAGSPRGCSTLITSAPWSPRIRAAKGPAKSVATSRTRTPPSAPGGGLIGSLVPAGDGSPDALELGGSGQVGGAGKQAGELDPGRAHEGHEPEHGLVGEAEDRAPYAERADDVAAQAAQGGGDRGRPAVALAEADTTALTTALLHRLPKRHLVHERVGGELLPLHLVQVAIQLLVVEGGEDGPARGARVQRAALADLDRLAHLLGALHLIHVDPLPPDPEAEDRRLTGRLPQLVQERPGQGPEVLAPGGEDAQLDRPGPQPVAPVRLLTSQEAAPGERLGDAVGDALGEPHPPPEFAHPDRLLLTREGEQDVSNSLDRLHGWPHLGVRLAHAYLDQYSTVIWHISAVCSTLRNIARTRHGRMTALTRSSLRPTATRRGRGDPAAAPVGASASS